jgi:hypothetical protein
VEDPKLDYKCLRKEVGKVKQNKAVFGRQEVLTNIFRR